MGEVMGPDLSLLGDRDKFRKRMEIQNIVAAMLLAPDQYGHVKHETLMSNFLSRFAASGNAKIFDEIYGENIGRIHVEMEKGSKLEEIAKLVIKLGEGSWVETELV